MKNIAIIVAHSINRVIGNKGSIPWHIPCDLRNFKDLTTEHVVIMGRKTYESLPESVRPLPNRHTVVLTQNPNYHVNHPRVSVCTTKEKALMIANIKTKRETIFVAGGEHIYRMFMPDAKIVYSTIVYRTIEGDAFFPEFPDPKSWIYNWGDSYYRNIHYRSITDNIEFATFNRWKSYEADK